MGDIFINYRREDAAAHAGRLCDQLNRLVGAERVFMDVEDIAPGQRFVEAINERIAHCDTVLIVVGPKWAEILQRRAQQPQPDYVREEIEAALARDTTVVPVLVGAASLTQLTSLPGKLSVLSQYEVAELHDSTFAEDCARLTKALRLDPIPTGNLETKTRRKRTVALLVGVLSVASLGVSGWMGIGPVGRYFARRAAIGQMLTTAKLQAGRSECESAFRTYQELLKVDPGNRTALALQVSAAMCWLRDFHVIAPEGTQSANLAGARLDEIIPVLDSGLTKVEGQTAQSADILAHLGWAHWLNQKLAQREFGPAAERDLREALRVDPSNVFANAMLANWTMQSGGQTDDALRHFRIAEQANKERAFVRSMELGVLIYPDDSETRKELIRVVNEMRRNGEFLEDGQKHRVLSAYSPTVNSAAELRETLSAVPPNDAWATYLWLDQSVATGSDMDQQQIQRDFIHASIQELDGKRQEALITFKGLQAELKRKGYNGSIATHVDAATKRLTVQ
jgi:tetratricopeptide (TPR) repeat protein